MTRLFIKCLFAGDIVYIPEYWWHYVDSYECPNIGINIWFSMFDFEHDFDQAGLSDNKDVVKVDFKLNHCTT